MTTVYKRVIINWFLVVSLAALILVSGCRKTEEAPTGPVTTFRVEPEARKTDECAGVSQATGVIDRLETGEDGTVLYLKDQKCGNGFLLTDLTKFYLYWKDSSGEIKSTQVTQNSLKSGQMVSLSYYEKEGKLTATSVRRSSGLRG